jgi:transposase
MSFHLDYLLDLPGVKVETCTQIEGQIYFRLRALASEIVCPHCNNYTEELHQNRPTLVRDLSVFGRECVFRSASSAVLLPGVVNVTLQKN